MEAKYYAPSIEEFHVGFEYEILLPDSKWHNRTFGIDKVGHPELEEFDDELMKIAHAVVRVKYLCQEDFESLGWKLIKRGCDYSFTSERYQFVVENFVNTGTIWQIYVMQPEHTPMGLDVEWQTFGSYDTENGRLRFEIKNKSELKKLMEQLGISNWKP